MEKARGPSNSRGLSMRGPTVPSPTRGGRMPRRGDGITKRKDGRFMARVTPQTPDGPRRKYIYGKKYGEVKKKRDLALGDAARGVVFDDQNMTVGGYLDRWLRDVVRGSERASTFDRDSYLVRVHISLTTTLEPGVVARRPSSGPKHSPLVPTCNIEATDTAFPGSGARTPWFF